MKASDYYKNINDRTAAWSTSPLTQPSDAIFASLTDRMATFGSGGRYLDIGCQAGGLMRRVQKFFDESVGIDMGSYDDEWKSLPSCKFLVHDVDAARLPFPDDYFRVVTCIMVLEHVFDVFGLVREARRILQPAGILMIEVPNIGYFKHIVNLIKGRVPRTGAQKYPFSELEGWDGQHLHQFTIMELKWLLEHSGFQIKETFSRGSWQGIRNMSPTLLYASIVMVAAADNSH